MFFVENLFKLNGQFDIRNRSVQVSCFILNFFQDFHEYPSRDIQAKLKQDVIELQNNLYNFRPGLRIVQVGGREDSNVYIRMKIKAATEIGIDAQHVKFPRTISETELLMGVRNIRFEKSMLIINVKTTPNS